MPLDLEKYREKLIIERDRLIDDVNAIGSLARSDPSEDRTVDDSAQVMGEGMDIDARVAEMKHARLERIEAALQSIGTGTYGICKKCGKEIDPRRLDAEPAAITCMDCQTAEEKNFEAPTL